MVGFGDLLYWVGRGVSTPMTAGAGFMSGLMKMQDEELDPENKLGYKDPIRGLLHGITNPRSFSNVGDKLAGDYNSNDNSGLVKALGYGMNIAQDPLTYAGFAGPALKGLGVTGKAAELATAAGTASKLEKGAGLGSNLAQAGRRFATGTRVSGGSPVGGMLWASTGKFLEPKIAARTNAITSALGRRAASKTPGVAEEAVASATPAVEQAVTHVAQSAPQTTTLEQALLKRFSTVSDEALVGRTTPGVARESVASATPKSTPKVMEVFDEAPEITELDRIRGGGLIGEPEVRVPLEELHGRPGLGQPGTTADMAALAEHLKGPSIPPFLQSKPSYATLTKDPKFAHLHGAAKDSAIKKALRLLETNG